MGAHYKVQPVIIFLLVWFAHIATTFGGMTLCTAGVMVARMENPDIGADWSKIPACNVMEVAQLPLVPWVISQSSWNVVNLGTLGFLVAVCANSAILAAIVYGIFRVRMSKRHP
jgi:hypothetical protein